MRLCEYNHLTPGMLFLRVLFVVEADKGCLL